jgi:hypothetical protein
VNWDAIGASAELLGAIGVIVTVIYLAVQIRQNTNQIQVATNTSRAESEREVLEAWNTIMADFGENQEVAEILGKGLADYHSLTQPEKAIFFSRFGRVLNHHYIQIRAVETGLGDENLLRGMDDIIRGVLNSPGGKQFWDEAGSLWVQKAEIDRILSETDDAIPWSEYSFWNRDGA